MRPDREPNGHRVRMGKSTADPLWIAPHRGKITRIPIAPALALGGKRENHTYPDRTRAGPGWQ
jgi:hypothetical protein